MNKCLSLVHLITICLLPFHMASAQTELPQAVRLNSRDLFGLATYYIIVTKDVLTSPQTFFTSMSLAGGLNDLDAAVDNGFHEAGIVRRRDRRQEGEVHAEGLVRHGTAARDFLRQLLGRALRESCNYS